MRPVRRSSKCAPPPTRAARRSRGAARTRVDVEGRRVDRSDRFEKREGRTIVAREDDRSAFTWYLEDEIATLLRSVGFTDTGVIAAPWQRDDGSRRFVAIARM